MFDWFVAELRCPACGTLNPADSATNMQTHLRNDADSSELRVGTKLDSLEAQPDNILGSCYLLVAQPEPGQAIRLLEIWNCPACGRARNWAMITIRDASIESIEAVILDRATLERAHFISDSCSLLAAQLSGISWEDLTTGRVDCVEVLRQHL